MSSPNMEVDLAGIRMKNPVMVASGTFGYGADYREDLLSHLGAVVVKGTTLRPRKGNPPPRIWETPSGIMNSIGLQNPGVEVFLQDHLPWLASKGATVICNIAGETEEEYAEMASRLDGAPNLAGIEVNVSCPNVEKGGLLFGQDPVTLRGVVEGVKKRTRLPVIVKLPPLLDVALIARAAVDGGADALSLINTVPAMAIDIERCKPALGAVTGGLSGPAIRPIAIRMVWICRETVSVPIIGMGGITHWRDALEFILAGAQAVAVGASLFRDPDTPMQVMEGLLAYARQKGVMRLEELVGRAHGSSGSGAGCRGN